MYVDTRQRLKIRIEIDSNLENLRQNFIFVQNAAKIFMYVQACQTSIARNFAYAHIHLLNQHLHIVSLNLLFSLGAMSGEFV